jgi:hypothetical protein
MHDGVYLDYRLSNTPQLTNSNPHLKIVSDAAYARSGLGDAEIHAMRVMFLLLAVSMVGHSSGQFLASGAVRVEDLSIIGAIAHAHTCKCIHAHNALIHTPFSRSLAQNCVSVT